MNDEEYELDWSKCPNCGFPLDEGGACPKCLHDETDPECDCDYCFQDDPSYHEVDE